MAPTMFPLWKRTLKRKKHNQKVFEGKKIQDQDEDQED